MTVILFALGLLAATFLVHLAWWRIRTPRRQTALILLWFVAALPLGIVVARSVPMLQPYAPSDVWSVLLVAQFQLGAALAYACINSALQHDSPALMVVTYIALSGPSGCTRDEVRTILSDDLLIEPRIREFTAGGLVEQVAGRYKLTPRGLRFLHTMTLIRRIFRLPRGG